MRKTKFILIALVILFISAPLLYAHTSRTTRALRIGSRINASTSGSILFVNSLNKLAQDNDNLFWDDPNNRLGIGTSAPDGSLDVRGDSFPVIISMRTTSNTDGPNSGFRLLTKSTGDMADGFGGGLVYSIDDTAESVQDIARISGIRDGADNTGALRFDTGGFLERMRIDSSGNVGIGTTDPGVLLQVGEATDAIKTNANALIRSIDGPSKTVTLALENRAASGSAKGAGIVVYSNDGAAMSNGDRLGFMLFGGSRSSSAVRNTVGFLAFASENWSDSQSGSDFQIVTTANGGTSRTTKMTIKNDGLVGIGIINPAELLEVEDSNAITGIQISNTATDGDPFLAFALSGTKTFTMGVDDGDSDKFKIGTSAIDTDTRLTINSAGRIGIGSLTDPATRLEIEDGNATTGIQISNTAGDGDPFLGFALSGVRKFTMGVDDGDGDKFKIGTLNVGANTRFTIDSIGDVTIHRDLTVGQDLIVDGNVGIDESTPVSTLDLNGSMSVATVEKTANYTLTNLEYFVNCDASGGSFTITLPTVSGSEGRVYHIKKKDSSGNTITIDGNGSETIDDATTAVLTTQYESIKIINDGTEWWIL